MTTTSNTSHATAVDWARFSTRLNEVIRDMVHGTAEQQYTGTDFYAEAVRRTLGFVPAGEAGFNGRALPYDDLKAYHFGLTTIAQREHYIRGAVALSEAQRETAEKQVAEMRAEVARVYREARQDIADYLRARCNERTVPSRYRREGVKWAADMVDPAVPKDRFGFLLSDGAA